MYTCSATTNTGFQAVMTEEMSENSEYGGDKCDNGFITPRLPPIQYRQSNRYNDRNWDFDRPRYGRPCDQMPMQWGNVHHDRHNFMHGDRREFTPPPPQTYPPQLQNFGRTAHNGSPPGGGGGRDYNHGGGKGQMGDPTSSYQRNYNQWEQWNHGSSRMKGLLSRFTGEL